jgi:hypothetical protein
MHIALKTISLITFIVISTGGILYAQTIPYDIIVGTFDEIDIRPENRITVLTQTNERFSGYFTAYTGDQVVFRDGKNETQSLPLTYIAYLRVDRNKSRHSLHYGIYGAIAGLFAGIPIGAHLSKNKEEEESANDAFIYIGAALGSAVVGGLIGTGIGLTLLPGETVYKIEHVRPDTSR